MPPARKGELTSTMAILGFLIKRPDSINGVKLRLDDRFPSADWGPSIAHSAMSSLSRQGFVRPVKGSGSSLDPWEATPGGVERFKKWLGEYSTTPPFVRDALRAKLQFIDDEDDLFAVVRAIREQEEACFEAAEAVRSRMKKAVRLGWVGPAKGADWKSRVQSAMMVDEAGGWGDMGKRLKRFREDLEDVTNPDEQTEMDKGDDARG